VKEREKLQQLHTTQNPCLSVLLVCVTGREERLQVEYLQCKAITSTSKFVDDTDFLWLEQI
jgi:hypothetical protein